MDDVLTIVATYLDVQSVCAFIGCCRWCQRVEEAVWQVLCGKYGKLLYEGDYKRQFRTCYVLGKFMDMCAIGYSLNDLVSQQKLDLRNNKLISLPKEIGNLVMLQYLSLHCNQLTSLPEEIGHLVMLQKLDLDSNKLTSLPKEIGNLAMLQVLDLRYNQLTSLPKEIGNLVTLQYLYLYNNQLTSLP